MESEQGGLQAGDVIVEINGLDTKGMGVSEVLARLRGAGPAAGGGINVSVSRDNGKEVNITMRSARVGLATVHDVAIAPQGIGYVRIGYFGRTTGEEFRETLAAPPRCPGNERPGPRPEGQPRAPCLRRPWRVAGASAAEGPADRDPATPHATPPTWSSAPRGFPVDPRVDCPIIVLVNHGSASASEIVPLR
jgi:carboxyl-terminal processing protease